jgi:hypothetical protein
VPVLNGGYCYPTATSAKTWDATLATLSCAAVADSGVCRWSSSSATAHHACDSVLRNVIRVPDSVSIAAVSATTATTRPHLIARLALCCRSARRLDVVAAEQVGVAPAKRKRCSLSGEAASNEGVRVVDVLLRAAPRHVPGWACWIERSNKRKEGPPLFRKFRNVS